MKEQCDCGHERADHYGETDDCVSCSCTKFTLEHPDKGKRCRLCGRGVFNCPDPCTCDGASIVALTSVVAAWKAWPGGGDGDPASEAMHAIHRALNEHDLVDDDVLTANGYALLAGEARPDGNGVESSQIENLAGSGHHLKAQTMLDAWTQAVDATWPTKPPAAVIWLRQIVTNDVPFTAPEAMLRPARKAWDVYLDEGDTPAGRAAVALTYILALDAEEARARRVRP